MADTRSRIRIVVPQRTVSGGLDSKFETDPYDVKLHGLMTPEQYTEAIENLNEEIRKCRAGKIDGALLATGAILVAPLVLWGVRHRSRTKKRKQLLKEGIHEFNTRYPDLMMRWNRRPQSFLTIEARPQESPNKQGTHVVEARLISDVGAASYQPLQQFSPAQQRQQQQQPPDLL